MRRLTVLALMATLLLFPAPALADKVRAPLVFTLPDDYAAFHLQDFAYRLTAAAGSLRLTATHYEYAYSPLFRVALADPQKGEIVSAAILTTSEPAAELTVPAAGTYDLLVRPLFEQWESHTNPTLAAEGEGLQLAERQASCVGLTDFADFTVISAPQSLEVRPCITSSAFVSRVAVNGEVLHQLDSSDGGRTHRLQIDPGALPDGLYELSATVRQNDSQNRSQTTRTFMIDQQDQYGDVPRSHWARHPVELMSHLEILSGRGAGQFAPDEPVLRKEFAKMVALTFDLPIKDPGAEPSPFADAPNDWSQPFLDALYAAGLAQGELVDGQRYFRPDRQISRAEAVTIIGRALDVDQADISMLPPLFSDEALIPGWAMPSIGVMTIWRWISGFPDGAFHAQRELQRAQAAKILAHEFGLEPSDRDGGGARPPGVTTGWAHEHGGPERSSYHPDARLGAAAEPLWSSSIRPNYSFNTVLGDGLAFTSTARGRVYALLPKTGEVLWTTTVGRTSSFGATVAYSPEHNLLYAAADGAQQGQVVALNPATGRKVWESATPGQWSVAPYSPVVAGGLVIVAGHGSGSTLYAFDADTGRLVWTRSSLGLGPPAAADGRVFQGNANGQVYAFRLSDGAPLWQRHNGWSGQSPAPVAGHGRLFVTSDSRNRIYALDPATGKQLWEAPGRGQAAVDDAQVWVQQPGGGLAVLDPTSGKQLASVAVCPGVPVVTATHAYLACEGQILAIDRTTFAVKALAPGGRVAAVENGRLYYLRPAPFNRFVLSALAVH